MVWQRGKGEIIRYDLAGKKSGFSALSSSVL